MSVTYQTGNTGTSSGASTQAAGAIAVTTGWAIFVVIGWEDAARTPTVTDTAGNTYSYGTVRNSNSQAYVRVAYCLNATGHASNVITADFGSFTSVTRVAVAAYSYTGTLSYDTEQFGTATASTTVTPTALTTAGAGVVIEGLVNYSTGATFTIASPFTERQENSTNSGITINDYMPSGAESVGATGTCSTSTALCAVTASFQNITSTKEQEGFRFGLDDGSESAHSWDAAQDTNVSSATAQKKLLRAILNVTGDATSIAYALRYQKNGTGGYVAVPVSSSTTPTLSWGAAGTIAYSASGGTSVAPTYPSGITTDSELVLVVGQKPSSANGGTCTTPAGWTLQAQRTGATDGDTGGYTTTLGADTGNTNIYVYTKNSVTGSESGTLSVTVGTNNVCWANIYRIQKDVPGTVTWAADTGKDTSAGNVSIATGNMSLQAGDFLIAGMVIPTDVTTPAQFSAEALAQTGSTFTGSTEIQEPDSTTGNDIGGFLCYDKVSSGSGSGAVTLSATAGGTTTNVRGPGFVLRARPNTVTNDVYVVASANVAAGGEATTARLTAPSGKSSSTSPTGDFFAGRRWDDENGSDALDLTAAGPGAGDYTELEWSLENDMTSGYVDFRLYAASLALDTYTVTPRWTVSTSDISSAGTITIVGSAALTAQGALAVSGTVVVTATSALTGSGTLASGGTVFVVGAAALTASGTLASTGTAVVVGAAGITAQGTVAASGALTITGAAPLTGVGTLAASGSAVITASADLTAPAGANDIQSAGTVVVVGSAIASATGTVAAAGALAVVGSSALTAIGSVAAAGTAIVAGSSAATGAGTVAAAGSVVVTGAADLQAAPSSNVSANGSLTVVGAALLSNARMFADGAAAISGSATLTASGAVAAAGAVSVVGSVAGSLAGTLASAGQATISGAALLRGVGALLSSGVVSISGVGPIYDANALRITRTVEARARARRAQTRYKARLAERAARGRVRRLTDT